MALSADMKKSEKEGSLEDVEPAEKVSPAKAKSRGRPKKESAPPKEKKETKEAQGSKKGGAKSLKAEANAAEDGESAEGEMEVVVADPESGPTTKGKERAETESTTEPIPAAKPLLSEEETPSGKKRGVSSLSSSSKKGPAKKVKFSDLDEKENKEEDDGDFEEEEEEEESDDAEEAEEDGNESGEDEDFGPKKKKPAATPVPKGGSGGKRGSGGPPQASAPSGRKTKNSGSTGNVTPNFASLTKTLPTSSAPKAGLSRGGSRISAFFFLFFSFPYLSSPFCRIHPRGRTRSELPSVLSGEGR